MDAGEPQILAATNSRPASVTVYLDLNHNNTLDGGDVSQNVDANGMYSFAGLADGSYSVGEVTPTSYIRTGAIFQNVTIVNSSVASGKDLANFPVVFDAGTNGNGSDQYTVRLNSTDTTRLEILQQLLGQSVLTYSIAQTAVSTITINAGGGDDMLNVDFTKGIPIPSAGLNIDAGSQSTTNGDRMTITGSSGPDSILMNNLDVASGAGSISVKNLEKCTLNGGNGNDTITLGPSLATDVVFDGGANTDQMIYTGTAGTDTVTLQAGVITNGANTWQYLNTESTTLNTLGGNDNVSITSTASGAPMTVNGGDGNDTLTVETTPASPLTFNGGLLLNDHDSLVVDVGTFTFDTDAALGTSNLSVSVSATGTAIFNSTQHLEALTLADGATASMAANGNHVLVTRNLSVAATGKLDLADNDLVLNYSALSPVGTWTGTAYSGVSGMIQSGYNGGAWNGNGIRSSSATSINELGIAEASQALNISGAQTGAFSGETVDSTSVLVKFTYAGDATMDGKLNVDDYGKIDFNVNLGTRGWFNGDFNYDGKINVDDYGKLDFTLGLQGGPL